MKLFVTALGIVTADILFGHAIGMSVTEVIKPHFEVLETAIQH